MYLSKVKVSYMLIIKSTQDHCPRKHPLLADQFLSTEAASVVFPVSTDELLLVLQAARQKRSRSHSPPCCSWFRAGFCAPPEVCPRVFLSTLAQAASGASRSPFPADGTHSPPPPLLAAKAPERSSTEGRS